MNIIICGAGRVGYTIAKLLSEQDHSITVIDQSSEDIQKIDDSLDVKAIVGKATYPSILEKADATEADMIIAVTRNDEINMLICQIAFSIFKIPLLLSPSQAPFVLAQRTLAFLHGMHDFHSTYCKLLLMQWHT